MGPGAQFGTPGKTGIKGVVVMPDNNCYTYNCPNPQVAEGEPAALASVTLYGENGEVINTTLDGCGKYEVRDVTDSCYILYAKIQNGNAQVKKGIYPLTSGVISDGGEANYYTTAQVIIYEVAKEKYPNVVKCSDIPGFVPTQKLLDAVKKALSECRDAQQDKLVRSYAADIASNLFGAPCNTCVPVNPPGGPTPSPTPQCQPGDEPKAGFTFTVASTESGWQVTFTNTSTGNGNNYSWDFGDSQTSNDVNPVHVYPYGEVSSYNVTLTATNPCGSGSITAALNFAQYCPINYSLEASLSANPSSPSPGQEVTFTASNTQSPISYPVNYSWDLDEDGEFDDGNGETQKVTFSDPGSYTIKAKAETECGSDEAEIQVTVGCVPVQITGFDLSANCECDGIAKTVCTECVTSNCKICTISIDNIQVTGSAPISYRYAYKEKGQPDPSWTYYPSNDGWTSESSHTFTDIEGCSSKTYEVKVMVDNDCTTEKPSFTREVTVPGGTCCEECSTTGTNGCYKITSSSSYNPSTDKTTFAYTVTRTGSGPLCKEISHWVLDFGCRIDKSKIVSKDGGHYTGPNEPTGVPKDHGIKWDWGRGDSHTFKVVIKGCVTAQETDAGKIKASNDTFSIQVCQPEGVCD
ncbi:MAG: PKD domain-containing protein [Candidatus Caldatribacteriaceae bacterium]